MKIIRSEEVGFMKDRLERIDPVMERYITQNKTAGIVTLVARHGKVAHFNAYGRMDLETCQPMTTDAIFRIYSMTKPITAVAAMMLLEEGRFRLFDPISMFLPEFEKMQVITGKNTNGGLITEPATCPITVRDLFTHTAGFSYGFDENDPLDRLYQKELWQHRDLGTLNTLAGMVKKIAALPLAYEPGTNYRYSVAIDVLGYLVEVVSGMPFDRFLHKRIFEPLGMPDSGFTVSAEKAHRLVHMYGPDDKNPGALADIDPHERSRFLRPVDIPMGGGGMVSTAADYLRFAQMILNGGELNGARLLGRKTVEFMRQNHLPRGLFIDPNQAEGHGLGGFVIMDSASTQVMISPGSWGWSGAANTYFWVDFQEDLIGLQLTQYQPYGIYGFHADFRNLVYQALTD